MYQFWIKIINRDVASMDLDLITGPTAGVVSVTLRYLIIESSFLSYINTGHYFQSYSSPYGLNSANHMIKTVNLWCSMNPGSFIMPTIIGWKLLQSASHQVSLYTKSSLLGSDVDIYVASNIPSSECNQLSILMIDIVVYDVTFFQAYYNS